MTFHDDVYAGAELAAYIAYQTLFVWLGTIAPVANSFEYMSSLEKMARELEWQLEEWPGEDKL